MKGQANGRLSGEGFVFTPQGGAVFPCAAPCADQVYSDQMQWQVTVYGELTGVSFASCGLAPVPSEKFVGTELNRNSCFSLGTGVRNSQKPTERDLWEAKWVTVERKPAACTICGEVAPCVGDDQRVQPEDRGADPEEHRPRLSSPNMSCLVQFTS